MNPTDETPPTTPTFELDRDAPPPPRPSKPSSSVRIVTTMAPLVAAQSGAPIVGKKLFGDAEAVPEPEAMAASGALASPSQRPLSTSPTSAFHKPAQSTSAFSFDSAFDPLDASPTAQHFAAFEPAAQPAIDDDFSFLAPAVTDAPAVTEAPATPVEPETSAVQNDDAPDQTAILNRDLLLATVSSGIPAHFLAAGRGGDDDDASSGGEDDDEYHREVGLPARKKTARIR